MIPIILYVCVLFLELLFFIGISFWFIGMIYSSIMGAPYVATKKNEIDIILKKANLVPGKLFIELGSGDGRIVRSAVRNYKVRGIGIDINPLLVILSRIKARREKLTNIRFEKRNIRNVNLREADYVYIFLMPVLVDRMKDKLQRELKKGTLIISHGFKILWWKDKLVKTIKHSPFPTYYYRI